MSEEDNIGKNTEDSYEKHLEGLKSQGYFNTDSKAPYIHGIVRDIGTLASETKKTSEKKDENVGSRINPYNTLFPLVTAVVGAISGYELSPKMTGNEHIDMVIGGAAGLILGISAYKLMFKGLLNK